MLAAKEIEVFEHITMPSDGNNGIEAWLATPIYKAVGAKHIALLN